VFRFRMSPLSHFLLDRLAKLERAVLRAEELPENKHRSEIIDVLRTEREQLREEIACRMQRRERAEAREKGRARK
jgi:hypothetical protein